MCYCVLQHVRDVRVCARACGLSLDFLNFFPFADLPNRFLLLFQCYHLPLLFFLPSPSLLAVIIAAVVVFVALSLLLWSGTRRVLHLSSSSAVVVLPTSLSTCHHCSCLATTTTTTTTALYSPLFDFFSYLRMIEKQPRPLSYWLLVV